MIFGEPLKHFRTQIHERQSAIGCLLRKCHGDSRWQQRERAVRVACEVSQAREAFPEIADKATWESGMILTVCLAMSETSATSSLSVRSDRED